MKENFSKIKDDAEIKQLAPMFKCENFSKKPMFSYLIL